MNKEEFLSRLSEKLATLEQIERVRMVQYYREIIEDRVEDGLTEEEAVAELEDLDAIAAGILDELAPKQIQGQTYDAPPRKKRSALNITLLVLGSPIWFTLLLAFGIVVLAMYIVVWSVIISLFAVVLSLVVCGIAGIFGLFYHLGSYPMSGVFMLGAGLFAAGLGLLLLLPVLAATKAMVKGSAKLGKRAWNAVFRRKGA